MTTAPLDNPPTTGSAPPLSFPGWTYVCDVYTEPLDSRVRPRALVRSDLTGCYALFDGQYFSSLPQSWAGSLPQLFNASANPAPSAEYADYRDAITEDVFEYLSCGEYSTTTPEETDNA